MQKITLLDYFIYNIKKQIDKNNITNAKYFVIKE